MKPKRTILCFDEEWNLPALQVVLYSRGYKVCGCTSAESRDELLRSRPIDLLLIGATLNTEFVERDAPNNGDLAILHRYPDDSMAQMLERIRVALVRKRGPKKPVAGCQGAVAGEQAIA